MVNKSGSASGGTVSGEPSSGIGGVRVSLRNSRCGNRDNMSQCIHQPRNGIRKGRKLQEFLRVSPPRSKEMRYSFCVSGV